jgi:hypothetical protein
MKICSLWILTALIAMSGGTRHLRAQEHEDELAITARVHGTFLDRAAGLGVLSGDMTIVRFEVRNRTVTAVGRIVGALADSGGDVLGPVDQELAVAVGNIESTCNQLRINLAAMDAEVLECPSTSTVKSRASIRAMAERQKHSARSVRPENYSRANLRQTRSRGH